MGAGNVLGALAGGYAQAAQVDRQRQFEDEQNRRSQFGDMLIKLASDENARPETRAAAIQMFTEGHQTPWNKQWKPDFNKLVAPPQAPQMSHEIGPTAPAQISSAQPGLTPGAPPQINFAPTPPPAFTSTQTAAGQPAGLFMTPEHETEMAAKRASAVAQATLGQHMGSGVPVKMPNGSMGWQAISETGQPLGKPISGYISPYTLRPHLQKVVGMDEKGQPYSASYDRMSGTYENENGEIIPNFKPYEASQITKETTKSTTTPGGMTTTSSSKTGPANAVAPKPTAPPGTRGVSAPKVLPPAVEGALTQIGMYGLPMGKMSDAQNQAVAYLKKQGIDPANMASAQGRSRADAAMAIEPLILKAQNLITANADKLGPIAGRWSELEKKAGNLDPSMRELAGTLISIYSLAGTMHGWRAIQVAEKFQDTYGGLSADPNSLLGGLKAMETTAQAVAKVGYPGTGESGMPTPPPATGTGGFTRIKASDGSLHDIPTDKMEAAKKRDPGLQVIQ